MASVIKSGIFFRHLTGLARFASAIQRPDLNLDESIKKVDQDVRRVGRISRRDIEEVFEEFPKNCQKFGRLLCKKYGRYMEAMHCNA
ncbi:hypothetical protein HA402_005480 [Bradysia odoriphaga]|nr:hypothetical protein HA402_005480 [Bradysia odoriphaga]